MAKENKIGPYPVYGFDAQKPPCINFTNMTGMEKIVDGKDSQRAEIVPRTTGQGRQARNDKTTKTSTLIKTQGIYCRRKMGMSMSRRDSRRQHLESLL
ncbi:Hypothetical predicted protein [Mytilus galloprovincialis]|nr:Hypothetical predicted protein [Mytilus galloprovincialis]